MISSSNQRDDFCLQANQIVCSRGERSLIQNLSFAVSSGELCQIVGPNGVGKSTLLRAIIGLFPIDAGEILWNGESVFLDRATYHRQFSYLGHTLALKSDLTVFENLNLDWRLQRNKDENFRAILSEFNLFSLRDRWTRQLSRGQHQRLALAKIALSDGPLWILDEPFAFLDRAIAEKFQSILVKKIESGGAVLLTTHKKLNFLKISPKVLQL